MEQQKIARRAGYFIIMVEVLALLPAVSSYAQDTADQNQQYQLGEVVVTAQRRAESLQDVPFSVTAFSASTLAAAGITDNSQLSLVTPGLRYNNTGYQVAPDIRGVAATNTFATSDPNVATYIDGVYQQTVFAAVYELPDVKEIEVLKGPQGTLFGRNATGGAVLINTLDPDLTSTTGRFDVGYASYVDVTGKGYISTPIVQDMLAASLTGYAEHTDGWARNILDGKMDSPITTYLARGKIRYDPWDGADFVLTTYYTRVITYLNVRDTNLDGNNLSRLYLPASEVASQPYTYALCCDPYFEGDTKAASIRGNIKIGAGTLTTTTGYTRNDGYFQGSSTNSLLPDGYIEPYTLNTFTQELVYTTDQLGKFHGTAGVFFYDFDGSVLVGVESGNTFDEGIWTDDKSKAYAVFGDVTYDILSQVSLTGGVRYSYEDKHAYAAFSLGDIQPTLPLLGQKSWPSVTPRASLLYKVTHQTNVYFTFSEGFKSGAFNTVSFQPTPVQPEKINAYEVGIKSDVSSSVALTGAVYYYDYSNLQVPAISVVDGAFTQTLQNAATSKIYGAELNANWKITDKFKLVAGGNYLHARYSSFPNASVNVPTGPAGCECGNATVEENISGNTVVGSPTLSGNLLAQYTEDTNWGRFDLSGNIYYTTKVYYDIGDRITQPAYPDLNASLAWQPTDSKLQVVVWGKNITDRAVIQSTIISSAADQVHFAPPRTVGVDFKYAF